jgi:O-antigen/teichoic acid export membrane protein
LLPSFSIACGAAIIPGLFVLRTNYRGEFRPSGTLKQFEMWNRILPYAAALWVLNFLSNMFEVSDRYMLLHLIPGGQEAGQAMVGQYHCGRILPNLLTSLALMLSGILLPFVSADWEAGKTEAIVARLRQVLQSLCIGFLALSIAAMSAAPILFHYGFKGRYELAESILPLSLLQATLASLFIVAQVYLLCAEKGRQLAGLMVVGLAANLLLNWWFIQHFGLYGAVTATALANLFTLSLLFWRMAVLGCNLGMGTMVLCLAPLSIVAGPVVASLALLAIIVVAGHTNWLLSDADRRQIDASLLPKLAKLGLRLPTLWP